MDAKSTARAAVALSAVGLMLTATGCNTGTPDRAGGGAGTKATVLTLALGNDGPPAQLTAWADQVRALSKGSITIDFKNGWRLGQTDYEVQTMHDVQQGKIDMASVGARALDRVGVTSFQALLAPMLVDSYDLESRIFDKGIPNQMLAGVGAADLVGVGVLPGPLRKIMGISKPFLTSTDFAGAKIADQDSALTQQTLQAWGATAVPAPSGAKLTGVDGYEQQLESIDGNHYDLTAKYTTANLNLWPRPLVIIMGKAAAARLSPAQQSVLRDAVHAALVPSLDASRQEDQQALPGLCATPMTLPSATQQQLADLRAAAKPIYASLRRNQSTKTWLDQIQALKDQLNAAPEAATCAGVGGSQQVTPIDGTYEIRHHTAVDWQTVCKNALPPNLPHRNEIDTLTAVFDHGTIIQYEQNPGPAKEIGWKGTYQVFRDTVQLTADGGGDTFTMTWSLANSALTLSNLQNSHDCGDAVVWTLHPWKKVK